MAHGFVYVLGNDSMPGIYKIGYTLKHPRERMGELSRATACPTPFILLAYVGCENPQEVEQHIHSTLHHYRVNHAREFFDAPAAEIMELLEQVNGENDDVLYWEPLDVRVYCAQRDYEAQWPVTYFFEQCADPIHWLEKSAFKGFE